MHTRSKKRVAEPEQTSAAVKPANVPAKAAVAKPATKRIKSSEKKDPISNATPKGSISSHASKTISDTAYMNADGVRTSVWLMKSEPDRFSIDDLINSKDSTTPWDGVRNHEAKNLMKNSMKVGDSVLFYHSNTKEPGIVALAKVAKESYPDPTAFDPKNGYYDEKSTKDNPRWFMVDIKFDRRLKRIITLNELRQYKDRELSSMMLLKRGRLSVQPISDSEMDFIMYLEQQEATE
ncbi:Thymocyte nuclear protein 1 [Entomortierella chlamydospora]|uniref:Thymocyte nuclear protein 1 n=1 Tax=Entomortierella chlamydospora TaxID=101097 RepID=A0A9P6SWF9_9FUNG|nr:Thymocyte nuclear protein 1 [Entomortierella chlamydospora]KAG0008391.1 Thymocyte nuclear protein 1 [Entomortierella chlamydospora]